MEQEQLHLTKACDLQRVDKTWVPGSLFVYTTRAVWRPSQTDAGGAGEQTFLLKDLSERWWSFRAPLLRMLCFVLQAQLGQRVALSCTWVIHQLGQHNSHFE